MRQWTGALISNQPFPIHFPYIYNYLHPVYSTIYGYIYIYIYMSQHLPPAISTALRILQPRHGTSCPTRAVPQPALGVQRCYGTNSLVRTYRPTTAAGRNFGWTIRVLGVLMGYVGYGLTFKGFGFVFNERPATCGSISTAF